MVYGKFTSKSAKVPAPPTSSASTVASSSSSSTSAQTTTLASKEVQVKRAILNGQQTYAWKLNGVEEHCLAKEWAAAKTTNGASVIVHKAKGLYSKPP